jgi:hypothetical protein
VPSSTCEVCEEGGMTLSDLSPISGCSSQTLLYGECKDENVCSRLGSGEVVGCMVETQVTLGGITLDDLSVLAASSLDNNFLAESGFMRLVQSTRTGN